LRGAGPFTADGNATTVFTATTAETGDIAFTATAGITNVSTPGVAGTPGTPAGLGTPADVLNDRNAVDAVSLFYYDDGTPVKNTSGGNAKVTTLTSAGRAYFTDLDLIVDTEKDLYIEARVSLRQIDTRDTARSGMAITGSLDISPADAASGAKTATVRGVDSGATLVADNINSTNDELSDAGDIIYVFNNKVIAEKSSSQDTSLGGGTEEVMKINLKSSGDNTAYLYEIVADFSLSGTAVAFTGSELYLDGAKVADGDGTTTPITFTLSEKKAIKTSGSVAIIKFTGVNAGTGDTGSIAVEVSINGSTPGTDGIAWADYGTTGSDGVAIQWIDLGSADSSTTTLSNTVKRP
jgi:hypothetical protein